MGNNDKNIKDMVKIAYDALEDKKGIDIKILELTNVTAIADYFIIATGNNPSQITALRDNVAKQLSNKGYKPTRIEGIRNNSWVLMDYEDIVVHIFSMEDREFYNLTHIWKDATIVKRQDI
jgi:ribosome-associated protein